MALFQSFTFTNDDLDNNYSVTFTHNKNTQDIDLEWWDEDRVKMTTAGIFDIVSNSQFTLNVGGPVTGTQTVRMIYSDNNALSGTRLFADLSFDSDFLDESFDTDNLNIAYGNDTVSRNVTLTDFITKCKNAGTGNLLAENNLSDLSNISTARYNLGVESISENNLKFYNENRLFSDFTVYSISPATLTLYKNRFSGVKRTDGLTPKNGKVELSCIINAETNDFNTTDWYSVYKLPSYYMPYETKYFNVISTTGKRALVRQVGTTFYNTTTNEIDNSFPGNGILYIKFLDAPTGHYMIDYTLMFNQTY